MVTPELVRPLAAGIKAPDVNRPVPFMKDAPTSAPIQPGAAVTGPVPMIWKRDSLPIEDLRSPVVTPSAASDGAAPAVTAAPAPSVIPALPLGPNSK